VDRWWLGLFFKFFLLYRRGWSSSWQADFPLAKTFSTRSHSKRHQMSRILQMRLVDQLVLLGLGFVLPNGTMSRELRVLLRMRSLMVTHRGMASWKLMLKRITKSHLHHHAERQWNPPVGIPPKHHFCAVGSLRSFTQHDSCFNVPPWS